MLLLGKLAVDSVRDLQDKERSSHTLGRGLEGEYFFQGHGGVCNFINSGFGEYSWGHSHLLGIPLSEKALSFQGALSRGVLPSREWAGSLFLLQEGVQ